MCLKCRWTPCKCDDWAQESIENAIAITRRSGTKPSVSAPIRNGEDIAAQPHYTRLSPQPIEIIEAWGLDFHLANAVKYIARAGQKPGASAESDLRKAIWYIRRKLGEQPLADSADSNSPA